MSLLDDDTMAELYTMSKEVFDTNASIPCLIRYETATKAYDEVNNVYRYSSSQTHEKIVNCSYNEQKQNGNAISSKIIQGIPSGNYNVYLKHEDRVIVSAIPDYVENSLQIIIRPNSLSPIHLHPILPLSRFEYLLEDEKYPLNQRFTCSVVM